MMSGESKGRFLKLAQGLAILIGALAALATSLAAYYRPERERFATSSYDKIREEVVALQVWAQQNRGVAAGAREECLARVGQLEKMVHGFMLGIGARRQSAKPTLPDSEKTVESLPESGNGQSIRGPIQPKARLKELPELKAPPKADIIQQQLQFQRELK